VLVSIDIVGYLVCIAINTHLRFVFNLESNNYEIIIITFVYI